MRVEWLVRLVARVRIMGDGFRPAVPGTFRGVLVDAVSRTRRAALSWWPRRPVLLTAAGGLAIIVVGIVWLGGLMVYYTIAMPNPRAVQQRERAPVIRILAQDGQVLAERGVAHDFMPLALLPDHVVQAVIATEDRRFYQHRGIDPWGLARAAFANLRAGRYAQGGSTLTQQLVKNLFLTSDRTLSRKVDEFALALWLELRLSKDDILELYLNRVYFGGGAFGIEAASQRYFKKSARELSFAEAAVIAGLLKAPSRYSPASNPALARARGRVVLKAMAAAGAISPMQEALAQGQPVHFASRAGERDTEGLAYLVDLVLDRLPPLRGDGYAEVVVETTVDADLQRQVQGIVQDALDARGAELKASQAAVVLLDMDGGIRAMVGGRSYAESQFNRAIKAKRQPGSAFKPIVYLAALEHGLQPETRVLDLPLNIDGWAPKNDSGRHRGSVSLREALAQSINTVAVRLMQDIGTQRVVRTAARLGIRSELAEKPSLALGTSEVTPMELTGAYAVLANGGYSVTPHVIKRVRVSSGRILHVRDVPRLVQVVSPGNVAQINGMMHDVLVSGTGRRAQLGAHPAAGKTGTTQDFRDAWFVGFTGHFAAGVWVGNDNGRAMNKVVGGALPADIWREAMRAAHQGRTPVALPGVAVGKGVETVKGAQSTSAVRAGHGPASVRDSRETRDAVGGGPPTPQRPRVARAARAARAHAGPIAMGSEIARPSPQAPQARLDADFIARAMAGLPPVAVPAGEVRGGDAPAPGRLPGAMGLGVAP